MSVLTSMCTQASTACIQVIEKEILYLVCTTIDVKLYLCKIIGVKKPQQGEVRKEKRETLLWIVCELKV